MSNFWENKNVLVTGATGLIGSGLVKQLVKDKAHVICLVRDWDPQSEVIRSGTINKTNVVNGSLEDFSCLDRAINEHEVDTIFHLGAQTIVGTAYRNPLDTFESNIRGTYNLLEACRQHRGLVKRVLVASSDKAYGEGRDLTYSESMPTAAKHPYDVSKSCTDLLSQTYFHTYELPIAIARCGNVYGPGDLNWSRIIPGSIKSFHQGLPPEIRSDGTFTRDYLFLEDVVKAYMTMGENVEKKEVMGQAFNFGPERSFSVLEIVDRLSNIMGCEHIKPNILNQAKAEIHDQHLSSEKAHKVLGWECSHSLEDGLRATVEWYKTFLEENK